MKISDFTCDQDILDAKEGRLISISVADEKILMEFDIANRIFKYSISLKTDKSKKFAGYVLSKMAEIAGLNEDADLTSLVGYLYPIAVKKTGKFYDIMIFPKKEKESNENESEDVPF
ncbi:MAG: hypothetical protein QW255_04660 [Candidatus Bilamarchaeaceae archaeon]